MVKLYVGLERTRRWHSGRVEPRDEIYSAALYAMGSGRKLDALVRDAAARPAPVDFNISVVDHEFDEGVFLFGKVSVLQRPSP
jgi:hypothetical protein